MKGLTRSKKGWIITSLIGAAIALIHLFSNDAFSEPDRQVFCQILCDALFIPAALLLSLGLLLFAANEGVFDMLHFSIQKAIRIVQRKEKRDQYFKTFYDYKVAKDGKPGAPVAFLLVPGLVFLAGAFIALLMCV